MKSLILRTATQLLLPLLLLFSVFVMLRGHNAPGGGFAGGLVAASAWALYLFSFSLEEARDLLIIEPRSLVSVGLLVALSSAMLSVVLGLPLMTGLWISLPVPMLGKVDVGTPLIFDFGVYLVVIGVTITILMTLAEE